MTTLVGFLLGTIFGMLLLTRQQQPQRPAQLTDERE